MRKIEFLYKPGDTVETSFGSVCVIEKISWNGEGKTYVGWHDKGESYTYYEWQLRGRIKKPKIGFTHK